MQWKMYSLLIIGMIVLLAVVPASAYDYQGVPREGENNPYSQTGDTSTDESSIGSEELDLSGLLGSADIANLISSILVIILRLLGISIPGLS